MNKAVISTNPADWRGCLPGPQSRFRCAGLGAVEPFGWYQWAIPTVSQNGPSCVGNAWANWLEMMIRRYVGNVFKPGEQIDGDRIWKHARDMFYHKDYSGGLQLSEGFASMMDLGILPVGCRLFGILRTWEAVSAQLHYTPLIQAHHIHPGWFKADKVSGLIDHTPAPGPNDGGHATVLMATGVHGRDSFFVGQNSWGPDYARYGFFAMTEAEWKEGISPDAPVTVVLPNGWEKSKGWKKYIVNLGGPVS